MPQDFTLSYSTQLGGTIDYHQAKTVLFAQLKEGKTDLLAFLDEVEKQVLLEGEKLDREELLDPSAFSYFFYELGLELVLSYSVWDQSEEPVYSGEEDSCLKTVVEVKGTWTARV